MAVNTPPPGQNAPTLSWGLGILALLPFIAGSYVALAGPPEVAGRTLDWLLVYATTIASFIGGIQWGLQIAGERARLLDMSVAVLPALIAWLGVMWGQPWTFALVVVALVVAWLADENGRRRDWIPVYLITLRRILTVIVLACLGIVGGAVLFR